jgi:hypothetical protein
MESIIHHIKDKLSLKDQFFLTLRHFKITLPKLI